jgi:hypothetical protein
MAGGGEEFVFDEDFVEFAAGDEHPKAEGGSVQPVVAVPDGRPAYLGKFGP